MVGGGAAMLILGFALPWSSISFGGVSSTGDGPFNYFITGGIAWLLVVAVGVLALLKALGKLPATQPWGIIFLAMAGIATLLMLIQVILGGRSELGIDLDRGIGMYGGLVWAAVTAAGAFMSFQAGGGELSDLTDMNKLKDAFDGDDAPPPPPAQ